jgi:hypothetical protein
LKKEILIIVCTFFFLVGMLSGQTLKQEVTKFFSEDKPEAYLAPLSKAFGATLGSSSYFSAKTYKFPHFDFGINYLTTPIEKSEQSYGPNSAQSPTVFGSSTTDSSQSRGLNINSFNIAVFQLNIGVGDNTNFLLRYSKWNKKKLGTIEIYGAGIKYELENLFSISAFPFSIGVLAMYQKYRIEDYIEGAIFEMNLIGSKEIRALAIEVYGGVGYLNNVTNVNNPASKNEVDISIPGLEEIRYQVGINTSISIFNLNTEYNFGEYKSISVGLRFIL